MNRKFMQRAIELAKTGMENNRGGPFGCVIVKNNEIVGEGMNEVLYSNDPSAHAEIVAIRNACKHLNDFQLTGCDIYTSCEPCPMCLGAIYWSRPENVYYAASKNDAARAGFDDEFIYEEISVDLTERSIPMKQIEREGAVRLFEQWIMKEDKTEY